MSREAINDLQPGTDYVIQVRAVRDDSVSDWSRAFPITTIVDTVKPKIPSNVTWVNVGDAFHGDWDAVTQNVSNDNIVIDHYDVELTAGATVKTTSVPAGAGKVVFDLSFESNRALFTTPKPSISIRVRAVDGKDLVGDWSSSVAATNPAPAPVTGLVGTAVTDGVYLKWVAPADLDLEGYNLYVGTSANPTAKANNKPITTTEWNYGSATYTLQFFKITSVDKFGQESTGVEVSATPISPFVVDTTAPATPTSLAASSSNNPNGVGANALVSWSQTNPSNNDLAGFVLRYRKSGSGDNYLTQTFDKGTTSVMVDLPLANTAYDFQVRSFDWTQNYSAYTGIVTAVAPSNAVPANVTGLTSTAGKDSITYNWSASADLDIRNYEFTFSTSPTFASGNTTFLTGTSTSLTVGGLATGTTYYGRVRAVDVAGNNSVAWSSTDTETTGTFPTANSIVLTATSQVLTSPSGGGATTPATTTVTGTAVGTTITTYDYSVDGAAFSTTVPAGVSRTGNVVTITGSTMTARTIAVRMSDGTISDTMTVSKNYDGAAGGTGGTGPAGADAYTVLLTNEAQTIAAGTTNANAGSFSTNVNAYKASTAQNVTVGTITGGATGITATVTNNGTTNPLITFTVTTALNTANGTFSIPVTVAGITFTQIWSWSLAFTGNTGNTGAAGVGVSGTTVDYQVGSSGTTAPTGTWVSSPQATSPGQYLWTRTVTSYTSGSPTTAYSVAAHGTTGATGVGITGTVVEYQVHSSGTTAPTGTWLSSPQATTTGQFLWTRTVTSYTSGSPTTAYSISAHGSTGSTGPAGAPSDGQVPGTGTTPNVTGGLSHLYVTWAPVTQNVLGAAQNDTVTYEVHLSTTTGFTPSGATKVTEISGTSAIIDNLPGTTTPLSYGTTYYIKIVPRDRDGSGTPSAQGSGTISKVASTDVVSIGADLIVPGTGFVNALVINSGGSIQSSNWASLTTGWKISPTGIELNDTGSKIKVEALQAGTIGGASGAGVINIAVGTSLKMNGGALYSNTYGSTTYNAGATAGWFLDNSNLHIPDGNISAKALKTGVITGTQTIELSGANAVIQSQGYTGTAGSGGFRLNGSGLSIPDGTLAASKLMIQNSANILKPQHADFEFNSSTIASFVTGSNATVSIDTTAANVKFNTQSLKIIGTGAGWVWLGTGNTDWNEFAVEPSKSYIISFYAMIPAGGTAQNVVPTMRYSIPSSSADSAGTSQSIPANGTWARYYTTVTTGATATGTAALWFTTGAGTMYFDGIQVEEKVSFSDVPSGWKPPGSTSIDGGMIRTGSIQSTQTVVVNGSTVPAWSINMGGYATFAGASILGNTVLGNGALDATSFIQSSNFNGTVGWKIDAMGNATFTSGKFKGDISGSSGTFVGNLTVGSTVIGATIKTAETGPRVQIDSMGIAVYGTGLNPFFSAYPGSGAAVIAGTVESNSLTVSSAEGQPAPKTSLGGTTEIASGGKITLVAGTTAPANPPVVSTGYVTTQFTNDGAWPNRYGWSTDGTYWYTAREAGVGFYAEKWNANGTLNTSVFNNVGNNGISTMGGSVVDPVNGYFYVLYADNFIAQYRVARHLTSTMASSATSVWAGDDGSRVPALGIDTGSGELLTAQSRSSNSDKVLIRRCTYVAGGTMTNNSFLNTDAGYTNGMASIVYGATDLEANRYFISNKSQADIRSYTFSGTLATYNSLESFPSDMDSKVGFDYYGGAFKSMDQTGLMKTYTALGKNIAATDPSLIKWVANTFYATSGPQQTTISPKTKFTMNKRSSINITTTAIPAGSGIDAVKIYVGEGTNAPLDGAMWLQTSPANGVVSQTLSTFATNGTPAPGGNTFNASAGSRIESASGGFYVDQSSNGSLGTGTFRDAVDARATAVNDLFLNKRFEGKRNSTNQTLATATPTTITFNTVSVNPSNWTQSAGVVTVPESGIYSITGSINFAAAAGFRACTIRVGNNTVAQGNCFDSTSVRNEVSNATATVTMYIAAGTNVELVGIHTTGANLAVVGQEPAAQVSGTILRIARVA